MTAVFGLGCLDVFASINLAQISHVRDEDSFQLSCVLNTFAM